MKKRKPSPKYSINKSNNTIDIKKGVWIGKKDLYERFYVLEKTSRKKIYTERVHLFGGKYFQFAGKVFHHWGVCFLFGGEYCCDEKNKTKLKTRNCRALVDFRNLETGE